MFVWYSQHTWETSEQALVSAPLKQQVNIQYDSGDQCVTLVKRTVGISVGTHCVPAETIPRTQIKPRGHVRIE